MTSASGPNAPLSRIPFTPRAEASILELSKWMRIAGIIGMAAAVLKAVVSLLVRNDVGQVVSSVVTFLAGFWTEHLARLGSALASQQDHAGEPAKTQADEATGD